MLAALVSNGGESQKKKSKNTEFSHSSLCCCIAFHTTQSCFGQKKQHNIVAVGPVGKGSPFPASSP